MMVDRARTLAELGYYSFRLRPGGKEPLTEHGFKDATRDERKLLHAWEGTPDANIGIDLGRSGCFVVDIDPKVGVDPDDVLQAIEAPHVMVHTGTTPGGVRGVHLYYRGRRSTCKTKLAGVEIRGDGAYVVAPGSLHPSGVVYDGHLPAVEQLPEPPPMVDALIEVSLRRNGAAPAVEGPIESGARNDTLTSLAGTMRRRGMSEGAILEALRVENRRCRPPLDDRELQTIARSIGHYAPEPQPQSQPQAKGKRVVHTTPARAIRSETIRWLWDLRIALRGLTVIAGEKGLGKSLATNAWLAARVSRGDLDGELSEPADVLVVTAEDPWPTVVKPRLMAQNADLDRVHRLSVEDEHGETMLTLPDDVGRIDAEVRRLRSIGHDVRLIVIDPIGAFLAGATKTHEDASVRRALAPLAVIAERLDLAISTVHHLTKDDAARYLQRVTGSGAFVNAARSVLIFVRDPNDEDSEQGYDRLILQVASNWERYAPTLRATVEGHEIDLDDGSRGNIGFLKMLGESELTVDDLQRASGPPNEIEAMIAELLAKDGMPSREVKKRVAKELGCHQESVTRAAMRMRKRRELVVTQHGMPRKTTWSLPGATGVVTAVTGPVTTDTTLFGPRDTGGVSLEALAGWEPYQYEGRDDEEELPESWWDR